VDVSVNLGVDATKFGSAGARFDRDAARTGKNRARGRVYAVGKNASAKAAGADIVGFEDLAEKVKAGQIDSMW